MVNIKTIVIIRVEGSFEDIIKVEAKRWIAAEKTIMLMAQSAPENGEGYDKADFEITWEDGEQYKGRIDLQKGMEAGYDLKEHIRGYVDYMMKNDVIKVEQGIDFVEKYLGYE